MSVSELQKFEEISKNIDKRCRTCLQMSANLNSLSQKITIDDNNTSLMDLILSCASIQVSDSDDFPQQICRTCRDAAISSQLFRNQCEKSNKYLFLLKNKISQKSKQSPTDNTDRLCKHSTIEETSSPKQATEYLQNDDSLNCDDPEESTHEENLDKLTCQCCNKTFSNNKSLIEHLKSQIFDLPIQDDQEVEIQVGVKHTCAICHKDFEHRSSMLRHQRKHDAPPKTCPYCTFQPSSPSDLAKHMEEHHAHLKTYKCKLCDKTFFKKTNLQRHLQVHEGVKKHICEICGTSFIASSNLLVHRRLHTGEKPYTCSWCGRGFTQHSALRSHEAGHIDKREHVCPECGVAFSRAGALRNHRKRHSSTKPFECPVCGRRFTFSSERKRHMLIHTGTKNYGCDICGSKFTRNNNLKVHVRIHTGETPHVCEICGKGFTQAHCLKIHLNNHAVNNNVIADVH